MAKFDDVLAITAGWPGIDVKQWYGTPGVGVGTTKKNAKGFCRMWSEREHTRDDVDDTEVLVVMCDLEEKDALIESADGVLFSTPHYQGYGALLIRMDDVDMESPEGADNLRDWLEDAYRQKASAKLIARLDQRDTL